MIIVILHLSCMALFSLLIDIFCIGLRKMLKWLIFPLLYRVVQDVEVNHHLWYYASYYGSRFWESRLKLWISGALDQFLWPHHAWTVVLWDKPFHAAASTWQSLVMFQLPLCLFLPYSVSGTALGLVRQLWTIHGGWKWPRWPILHSSILVLFFFVSDDFRFPWLSWLR